MLKVKLLQLLIHIIEISSFSVIYALINMNKYEGVLRPRNKPPVYNPKAQYYREDKDEGEKKSARSRLTEAGRRVARSKSVDATPNQRRRFRSSPKIQRPRSNTAANTIDRLAISNALLTDELFRLRRAAEREADKQEERYAALSKRDEANQKLIGELATECNQKDADIERLRNKVRLLITRLGKYNTYIMQYKHILYIGYIIMRFCVRFI